MKQSESGETPRAPEPMFAAVNAAFGSLGRACVALDGNFRIRYASDLFDTLLGPGMSEAIKGLPIEAILGEEIHKALRRDASDKEALENAQRQADRVMREAGYY